MSEPSSKHPDSTWGKGVGYLLFLGLIGVVMIPLLFSHSTVNRVKNIESRNNVGAMNRGQQAHFITDNTFAQSVNDLQLGIHPETANYRYSTQAVDNAAFQYGISLHPEIFKRKPGKILGIFPRRGKEYAIPSYLGIVWVKPDPNADSDEPQSGLNFLSILCVSTYPYLLEEGLQPSSHNGDFKCPDGMVELN
ncbi:type IV pilin-like G/H family protein [Oscillatoria acuminata]|uniref:Uncharacterized protein n=1 Tax=Oscillatoria acuminata PCC 6304 TaxID=56110 RepID=K9TGL9_9CYAN|nr:type IV pilin-like G/H family protein [Oscillatoria acuminata]AFY81548.1 hypothetical protein Oscil6304_1876 [Oscillatoria acuminata PCC 6304]